MLYGVVGDLRKELEQARVEECERDLVQEALNAIVQAKCPSWSDPDFKVRGLANKLLEELEEGVMPVPVLDALIHFIEGARVDFTQDTGSFADQGVRGYHVYYLASILHCFVSGAVFTHFAGKGKIQTFSASSGRAFSLAEVGVLANEPDTSPAASTSMPGTGGA